MFDSGMLESALTAATTPRRRKGSNDWGVNGGVGGGMSTFLPEMLSTAIVQCFVNIINTQISHYVGDLAECNIMW